MCSGDMRSLLDYDGGGHGDGQPVPRVDEFTEAVSDADALLAVGPGLTKDATKVDEFREGR